MLFYKHIYFFDPKWNMTVGRLRKEKGVLDERHLKKEMIDCYIIHYASPKPWKAEMSEIMSYWWKYVNDSPFVTEILQDYRSISDCREHFLDLCQKGEISLFYIMKCLMKALGQRIMKISTGRS